MYHVVISAFSAGAFAAIIVNPLKFWLAIAQNSTSKSIGQVIMATSNIRSLWKGVHFSIAYQGFTAGFLFVVLEKLCQVLDCSITEAE